MAVPMTAPLSPAQAEHLARIEAAPDAEESLRERVARAIWDTTMRDTMTMIDWRAALDDDDREFYRAQADAAIAAVTTPVPDAPAGWNAEAAVRRVVDGIDTLFRFRGGIAAADLWWALSALRDIATGDSEAVAGPAAAADTQGGGR